jgi:transposase
VARYGQAYKDRIVARLLPPESSSVEHVSREVGISVATLERWRANGLADGSGAGRPRWTAAARLQAVIVTAAMDETMRNAWCREQGLFRRSWMPGSRMRSPVLASRGRPAQRRPDRSSAGQGVGTRAPSQGQALAETAALLVLSKKLSAAFMETVSAPIRARDAVDPLGSVDTGDSPTSYYVLYLNPHSPDEAPILCALATFWG